MTTATEQTEPARRPVTLQSPLPPEAIAERLKAIMADPMEGAKARVFGKGSQHEMQLRHLRRGKQTGLEPVLVAQMEPHEGGTRIIGHYGPPVSPRLLTCGCYAFLSIFVVIGLLIMIGDWLFGLIFAGAPLLLAYAGHRALRRQAKTMDDDWHEIESFLSSEIDAHMLS